MAVGATVYTSYLALSWFQRHAGRLQRERDEIKVFPETECHVRLHAAAVADVERLHVFRIPSLAIAFPGLTTVQWTKEILVYVQNVHLLHEFVFLGCLLPTREYHSAHKTMSISNQGRPPVHVQWQTLDLC